MATNWHFTRIKIISAQGGKCFNSASGCINGARDVVAVDGKWVAFCMSCRLKRDASTRIPKSLHTKKQLKSQVTIGDYLERQDRNEDMLQSSSEAPSTVTK